MKTKLIIVCLLMAFNSYAGKSNYNKISLIVISSDASSGSHIVQLENSINDECIVGSANRVMVSKDDKDILNALLMAKFNHRPVSFYYDVVTTTTGDVPGHGSTNCQLRNIWF